MHIRCPICAQELSAADINVDADLAVCPGCDEAFRPSEQVDADSDFNPDAVEHPPGGTWCRKLGREVIVGATTRSAQAFFLVPFMCVWSGFSLGGIYGSQIYSGEFNWVLSLFGIPFLIGSVIFWTIALMAICGKVEVHINGSEGYVFTGIGPVGRRSCFDWSAVRTVRDVDAGRNQSETPQGAIALEGKNRVEFGSGLSSKRRYYLVQALKGLMLERDS